MNTVQICDGTPTCPHIQISEWRSPHNKHLNHENWGRNVAWNWCLCVLDTGFRFTESGKQVDGIDSHFPVCRTGVKILSCPKSLNQCQHWNTKEIKMKCSEDITNGRGSFRKIFFFFSLFFKSTPHSTLSNCLTHEVLVNCSELSYMLLLCLKIDGNTGMKHLLGLF